MMFSIIVLMAIIGLIATDLFVPSLPALAQVFHQPANHMQLTITLFLLGFAVSQVFYGPVSDRTGRKGPIMVGVALFVLGSLMCIVSSSFVALCLGRLVQGIGAGSGLSLARVVLRDLYEGTRLAVRTSQTAMFICMAPALAPCIGGLLQAEWGYRAPFVFMLVYGLVLLVLLFTHFRETLRQRDQALTVTHVVHNYRELLGNFMFMRYVVVAGIAFGAVILYANTIPFIVQNQLHYDAAQNGYILLLGASGLTISALIGSKIVHRFHSYKLSLVGLSLLLCAGVIAVITELTVGTHVLSVIVVLFFTTLGMGLLLPNSLALAFSQIRVKIGVAGAIYGSTQIAIAVGINLILNTIVQQTQLLLGVFYISMSIVGLALLLLKRHPIK